MKRSTSLMLVALAVGAFYLYRRRQLATSPGNTGVVGPRVTAADYTVMTPPTRWTADDSR